MTPTRWLMEVTARTTKLPSRPPPLRGPAQPAARPAEAPRWLD
jgi:hypothetical protein